MNNTMIATELTWYKLSEVIPNYNFNRRQMLLLLNNGEFLVIYGKDITKEIQEEFVGMNGNKQYVTHWADLGEIRPFFKA